MATTLEIIEATAARLREKLPQFAVEFYPDKPREYRLNHPRGALLVSYAGSRYGNPDDTAYVAQRRTLQLTVNVVMRQLNGRGGAVEAIDAARLALLGWRPPDCQKLRAAAETYLGEQAGLWQYALDLSCESVVIEDTVDTAGPLLTEVNYEDSEE
ncbi:MAG: Gp37 family protein [Candidatus Accumulibacter sp.]|jgi:hypothetical protein|nr:Gp37 family protein [Accumulibacter sp.]